MRESAKHSHQRLRHGRARPQHAKLAQFLKLKRLASPPRDRTDNIVSNRRKVLYAGIEVVFITPKVQRGR
jgi:hypothetical protein